MNLGSSADDGGLADWSNVSPGSTASQIFFIVMPGAITPNDPTGDAFTNPSALSRGAVSLDVNFMQDPPNPVPLQLTSPKASVVNCPFSDGYGGTYDQPSIAIDRTVALRDGCRP